MIRTRLLTLQLRLLRRLQVLGEGRTAVSNESDLDLEEGRRSQRGCGTEARERETDLATGKLEVVHLLDSSHGVVVFLEPVSTAGQHGEKRRGREGCGALDKAVTLRLARR